MINDSRPLQFSKKSCFSDEDLYLYISGQGGAEKLGLLETHLSECPSCRRDLANLIEILHPEPKETMDIPEYSEAETDRTIAAIREISRKEHSRRNRIPQWIHWPMAAAAVIGFVALCLLGIQYLNERNRSEVFFLRAKAMLEQNYTGTSPGNLRLSLPFNPTATNRSDTGSESLRAAENLFFQALAVRGDMIEAHLGLGCIYLNEAKFARARNEFQKVLDIRKNQGQALLSRGVAQYEEAVQGSDPLQRDVLLKSALNDFDAVLKANPGSAEARYDKIWTLFESGLHKEALQEIELYLARDPGSIWAEGLKGLRTKIKATQSSAVEEEVNRAARTRDRAALVELSRQAPYQIPAAIWSAMRRSLAEEKIPINSGKPSSEDLRWAAETMEAAYSEATGDHSFRAFIDFYDGLSPPQREIKKSLDQKFQTLVELHQDSKFDLVLRNSKSLESQYAKIKDSWQLLNLHHLRGNSLYMGKADFRGAESEFRSMYEISHQLNAPDPTAKALRALAMIYFVQRKFDQSMEAAKNAKDLAINYKIAPLQVSASIILGYQHCSLGHYRQALNEYSAALILAYPLLFDGLKIIEALENSGMAMDRLGRIKEAASYYRLAVHQQDVFLRNQVLRPIPETTSLRLNLLFKQGDLALRNGDLAGAEAFFQNSLRSVPQGMRELEARNRIGLTQVYLRTKRISEAETMLGPVMSFITSGQYPEIEWKAQFLKGMLLQEAARPDDALLCFRQSISTLEQMRQHVKREDMRESFLVDRYDPYKAVAELLFRSRGDRQQLVEFVDEAKSATLKENLDQEQSGIGLKGERESKERSLAIIEYFFTRDRLLILLTHEGHMEAVAQNISSEEMHGRVEEFLQSIRENNAKKFSEIGQRLYAELIAPVENYTFMHKSETLVILPDGPLYLLPFAGLQDTAGRFLIEKSPLVFAPSRSVFRHCLLSGGRRSDSGHDLLLIDGSAGLPNARDELAYISNLYGKNALVLGAKDLPVPAYAVEHSNIIHFSGHAILQQGQPSLLLQRYPKEIYLDCRAIRKWKMPRSQLVNLAGCSTGIGPIAEGEAPWGLIPAFLDAGAPAILASPTEVDDASTKRLSCRFYDLLRKGTAKAKALQLAQLDLLNSVRSSSTTNPQSWIPYMLVGNPQ
jgi:CHAT domain-containing protein